MKLKTDERIEIRSATESDVPLILSLIKDLAAYEKLSHEVVATESILRESLFDERPYAEVCIGYYDSNPAGFEFYRRFNPYRRHICGNTGYRGTSLS